MAASSISTQSGGASPIEHVATGVCGYESTVVGQVIGNWVPGRIGAGRQLQIIETRHNDPCAKAILGCQA
jgi:hypothetical protein